MGGFIRERMLVGGFVREMKLVGGFVRERKLVGGFLWERKLNMNKSTKSAWTLFEKIVQEHIDTI